MNKILSHQFYIIALFLQSLLGFPLLRTGFETVWEKQTRTTDKYINNKILRMSGKKKGNHGARRK